MSSDLRASKTDKRFGIFKDDRIHMEHLLAILLYCDNSKLCESFRESFRKMHYDDTKEIVIQRHIDNYYWFGRFLFAAIEFWGAAPRTTDTKKFYHGTSCKFLFDTFSAVFETPTSTTWDKIIATNFCRGSGVVLHLAPKFKDDLNPSKFLNVSDISHFPHEKERLFAGMTVLAIINITESGGKDCSKYMKCMLYFERIIEQNIHNKDFYNYGVITEDTKEKWMDRQQRYLLPLIRSKMDNIQKKIPQYVFDLFANFCDKQTAFIDLSCIQYEKQFMCDALQNILFDERQMIHHDNIKKIFSNITQYKNDHGYWVDLAAYESKACIEFNWPNEVKSKKDCGTREMLYLLQLALERVRKRTNERNKYFESINRKDRYIAHLDAPQIITNFLDWHGEDNKTNKFDGELVTKSSDSHLVEEVIAKIGRVPLGVAIRICIKLKGTTVDYNKWTASHADRLKKIKTRGYDRMYKDRKKLEECTVDEVITLLTFVNEDTEQKGDGDVVQGIFATVEHANNQYVANGRKSGPLFNEPDWKDKIVNFFRDNNLDGKKFVESEIKEVTSEIRNYIVPLTEDTRRRNLKLTGGVKGVLGKLRACDAGLILETAHAQQNK
eukprot:1037691_1